MKIKSLRTSIVAIIVVFASMGSGTAWSLSCGATLTHSMRLHGNLENCSGDGLVIGADGITLNCAGFKISGNGATGSALVLDDRTRVTIKNCRLMGFVNGIELTGGGKNTIYSNRIVENSDFGISLVSSNHNKIYKNRKYENGIDGI